MRRRLRTPMRLVLVALLAAAVSGCQVMQRISESSYRKAVANGAAEELEARGVELREAPACTPPETRPETRPGPGSVLRVTCTARTRAGEPVTVSGVVRRADAPRPRETYVVTVGGREVLRKDCLGSGCRRTPGDR